MSRVAPYPDRATLTPTRDGLEVVIPSRKNAFLIVFLLFWLCGWLLGETLVIHQLATGTKGPWLFMAVWLAGWTAGGAGVALTWLWYVAGREILRVGPATLTHIRSIGRFGIHRDYEVTHVGNLRTAPTDPLRSNFAFPGLGGGAIAFDYGARTLRVGGGVDEAEADRIVAALKRANARL
jgi:hypothetical protein